MNEMTINNLRYLSVSNRDEDWGIVVTTVGSQTSNAASAYPPSIHPEDYTFKPQTGRILNEYQLVYITKGSGYFSSQNCKKVEIKAGTIILLFPGEWHSYYPNPETGWEEYWVGFRGAHIDRRVEKRFFTPQEPLHNIGINASVIEMYNNILIYANTENLGYQQMISSIVLNILGHIYYYEKNSSLTNQEVAEKMYEARRLMKENARQAISPEEIAEKLCLGYTWFRRMFKKHTGVSPAKYLTQQRLLIAKEMLTTTNQNINEIAYELNFKSGSQFATFFKKLESITPTEFRERSH